MGKNDIDQIKVKIYTVKVIIFALIIVVFYVPYGYNLFVVGGLVAAAAPYVGAYAWLAYRVLVFIWHWMTSEVTFRFIGIQLPGWVRLFIMIFVAGASIQTIRVLKRYKKDPAYDYYVNMLYEGNIIKLLYWPGWVILVMLIRVLTRNTT